MKSKKTNKQQQNQQKETPVLEKFSSWESCKQSDHFRRISDKQPGTVILKMCSRESSYNEYISWNNSWKQLLYLRFREHCGKWGRKFVRAEDQEFAVILWLLVLPEAITIKSHQHDFLNISWTRRIPISMPKWMRERPQGLTSAQRTTGN